MFKQRRACPYQHFEVLIVLLSPSFPIFVDLDEFTLDFVNVVAVINHSIVYNLEVFFEEVVLLFVQIGSQVHLLFLSLLDGLLSLTFSLFLSDLFQSLSLRLFVLVDVVFRLSYKFEDDVFEINLVSILLYIAPDNHDSVL